MGVKRLRGFILTIEDDDEVSQSETETEDLHRLQNGKNKKRKLVGEALNPEFEFDGYGASGRVHSIEEEGWDLKGIAGMKESSGFDLEGIIARRWVNVEEDEGSDDDQGMEGSEESDDEEEFQGFDDDEIIGKSTIFTTPTHCS